MIINQLTENNHKNNIATNLRQVISYKNNEYHIVFDYRIGNQIKSAKLTSNFSDEGIKYLLPENPTREDIQAQANALANKYIKQAILRKSQKVKSNYHIILPPK